VDVAEDEKEYLIKAEIRRQLELPPRTGGVVVAGVEPGTPAEAVRRGRGEPLTLLVNRGGSTLYVVVEPR
jgi:hypothetical protein